MIDLNAAAIFVRVAEEGGFTAAARALGCPKTTVSKKVADLEKALGVRLLQRTTRRVSMTEAGGEVYRHCIAALEHIKAAERAVQASQREPTGTVTIGASGPLGAFLLPAITPFMHAYPGVEVTHLAIEGPIDQAAAGIDVSLVVAADARGGENVRPITSVEIALFASIDYAASRGLPSTPGDLARHLAIAPTQALVGNAFAWTLRRGEETATVAPDARPRLRSNDAAAILAAVAAGHGIGALSPRFVAASPHAAALVPVLPDWRVPSIELSAICRDGGAASLKNRLFVDFITDWFRTN